MYVQGYFSAGCPGFLLLPTQRLQPCEIPEDVFIRGNIIYTAVNAIDTDR